MSRPEGAIPPATESPGQQKGNVVTYLWWAIDSAIIRRIGRRFERLGARREASLYHDWDLELTEAEAERENWEPDELWAAMAVTMARHGG